jgi:hypothetical protein
MCTSSLYGSILLISLSKTNTIGYYDSRNAVLTGTPQDLLPKRTGPHTRSKRTKEVEALIIRTRVVYQLS